MRVKLKEVRLSYPYLFTKAKFKDTPTGYEADFIFSPDSDARKDIAAAINHVGQEKWKSDWKRKAAAFAEINKIPLRKGSDKPGYTDNYYIKAKTKRPPLIVDRQVNPVSEEDNMFYAGCYVNAVIDIVAATEQGGYICARLAGVQFVRDGEPLGGMTRASAADFEDLGAGERTNKPASDADEDINPFDDIPF